MTDKPVLPAKEQLQAMYDFFPAMVWVTAPDKKYIFFNKQWLDFRQRSMEQEIAENWTGDIHPEDREKYISLFEKASGSNQPFQLKYRLKHYDGDYRWLFSQVVPQFNDNGLFAGYLASSVDIQELTEELTLRDRFISSASHELKIPVTTIKVYAQLLEDFFDRDGDEKHLNFLKKVNKQVVKLTRLINNLGESNQLHQSGLELNKSVFDFNKMIAEEISRVQAETSKHNIRFKGYTSQNVYGDRERLAQAFTNILDNAIKFSPEADAIDVTMTDNQNAVTVSVRDYGIGINNKESKNIFKRFYRVNNNTANTFPGVGLGLYISSQIINRHGGEIVFEQGNPGSTFKFILPYDKRT